MKTAKEIIELAGLRIDEAQILLNNKKSNGAFYLLGYSIELYLKYRICKMLNIDDLFDENCSLKKHFEGRNPFFSHDLNTLLVFSGLKHKLDAEKATNKIISKTISLMIGLWSEKSRYDIKEPALKDVQEMIDLLKDPKGLLKWIEDS